MAVTQPRNNMVLLLRIVLCGLVLPGISGCQKTNTTGLNEETTTTASDDTTGTGQASLADVIKENSRGIDELGKAAALMTECSDIIMRYSHFTDNHTEQVVLCPECATGSPIGEEPTFEDPEEEYPATINQLLTDSRELRKGIGSINIGLQIQLTALRRHLNRLRENAAQTLQ